MNSEHEIPIIEVFSGSFIEVGMVKTLLEDAEIRVFIKDEIMGSLNPWHTSSGGFGAVKIFVSNSDKEKAEQIVTEYLKE